MSGHASLELADVAGPWRALSALPLVDDEHGVAAKASNDFVVHMDIGVFAEDENDRSVRQDFRNRRFIRKNRPHATISNRLNEWSRDDVTFRAFANNNTRLTDGNHVHPVTAA